MNANLVLQAKLNLSYDSFCFLFFFGFFALDFAPIVCFRFRECFAFTVQPFWKCALGLILKQTDFPQDGETLHSFSKRVLTVLVSVLLSLSPQNAHSPTLPFTLCWTE